MISFHRFFYLSIEFFKNNFSVYIIYVYQEMQENLNTFDALGETELFLMKWQIIVIDN